MAKRARVDRSYLAVRRQITGMDCEVYEIGIRDAYSGKMILQTYTAEQVLKSVSFLKHKNFNGCDIYIRPKGEHGLILLDDIGQGTVDRMALEGFSACAVIETSPMNYQAWVRLSEKPLNAKLATAAARWLAKRYGADPNSADWRHFGRLAGFTNRKPQYNKPYVLAHSCNPHLTERRFFVLSEAQKILERTKIPKSLQKDSEGSKNTAEDISTVEINPVSCYRQNLAQLLKRYPNPDYSRLDWMIATSMAEKGFTDDQIAEALRTASPELEQRKKGHLEDYIRRTLAAIHSVPN